MVCFILYVLYFYNNRNKSEKLSKILLNNFNIERIYSKNQNYTIVNLNKNSNPFVIGILEIPKINLKYPILSNTTNDALKISPCRFYGPYPNEVGNLCIAAHNYDDNRFFGNLNKLSVGDFVNINCMDNSCIVYTIYNKFEISESNIECTNQNTMGKKEITLITCNNINKNRLVVKAKEKQEKF
ncbi:MAG: sortase [Clostridia bacterium]|nr:sortase [Clostridia bacterium]